MDPINMLHYHDSIETLYRSSLKCIIGPRKISRPNREGGAHDEVAAEVPSPSLERRLGAYHAFGLIGTALLKNISVCKASSLKVGPISPNAS
jgi:hypothetical protein